MDKYEYTFVTLPNKDIIFPEALMVVTRDSKDRPLEAQRYYRHDTIMGDLKKVLSRLDNA